MQIVTVDSIHQEVLRQKAEEIPLTQLNEALSIGELLIDTAKNLGSFAGLAAPQIGISKAVFIYSYDRTLEHVELVINPTIEFLGDEKHERWEACFSVIKGREYKIALLTRYDKIKVSYYNSDGDKIQKVLDGFAAQVFQHEYDHLQGIVNIEKPGSEVKPFKSKEDFDAFMKKVREEDSKRYN